MRHVIAAANAALLALALTGCAGMSGSAQPAPPPDTVTQSVEQNGRFIAFVGPRKQHSEPFMGIPGTNFSALRSWIDRRNGEITHQIYVEDSYTGPERTWNAARDASGKTLRFIPIHKEEIDCSGGRCSYAEEFAAALPEPELRAAKQGLTVFFAAKSGAQMAIPVSADAIAKQLAAVDGARATAPTAAATPPPPR